MSTYTDHLVFLADALAAHENVSHWAISMRLAGKGDLIERLRRGGDVRTGTYESLMQKLSQIWFDDLEWPHDIPRPSKQKDAA